VTFFAAGASSCSSAGDPATIVLPERLIVRTHAESHTLALAMGGVAKTEDALDTGSRTWKCGKTLCLAKSG
jgi:hypothetical protein